MTPKSSTRWTNLQVGCSDIRVELLDILGGETFEIVDRLSYDERCGRAYEQLKHLNDLGYSTERLWKQPQDLAAFQELTAVIDPSLSMMVATHHFLSFGAILASAPDRGDLASWFDTIDRLDRVSTFVITESGYGNSHARLETRLDFDADADEIVIHTPSTSASKVMSANALAGVPKIGVVVGRLFVKGEDRGGGPSTGSIAGRVQGCRRSND